MSGMGQPANSNDGFFRVAFEKHSAIMLLIDPTSGIILEANQAAVDFYGYPAGELRGMLIKNINCLTPEQIEARRLDALQNKQNTFIFDHRLANGEIRTVEVHSSPIEWQNKKVLFSIITDITTRKQAENALRESEARWQFALEGAGDGVWDWNIQTNQVFFSDRWKALMGFEPHEIEGNLDEWDSRVHEEDKDFVYAEIEKHFSGQTSLYSSEHRVRCKDGSYKWILDRGKIIIRAEDGTPLRMIGTHTDITERKLAEERLRKSEEKFRALAENTPNVVYQCRNDAKYSFIYLNDAVEKLTGYRKEEFLERGMTFFDLYHPDDLPDIPVVNEKTASTINRKPFHISYRIVHKSGEIRWVNEWGIGIYEENGDTTLIGSMLDITATKKWEQELRAEHEFANQIIDAMGQGLTVTNAEGKFEFVNPAYASLFGYTPQELIGHFPSEVTHPEDRKDLTTQRENRIKGTTSTYESRLLRKDGSVAPVLITGVPRKDSGGNYAGAIAVITDLSEQKRIEDQLRQTKKSLEEALTREHELANTDVLVGIHNRRHLFEIAEQQLAIAARYKQPLAVLMFDIDHFKNVNDAYGHAVGDSILKGVVQIANSELRSADVFGRYGGEEFVLLLPMTHTNQAYSLAERIRTKVAGAPIPSTKGESHITISIGIVKMLHTEKQETAEDIFRRADIAMYAAKASGRNCTVILDME